MPTGTPILTGSYALVRVAVSVNYGVSAWRSCYLAAQPAGGSADSTIGRSGWPGEHMVAIRHSIAVLLVAVGVVAGSDTTTEPSPESSEPATTDVGRIMFQRAPGGEVLEAEATDVYVVNADGSEEQLLAAGAGAGRWAPDGSEVSIFCCDDPTSIAHFVDVATGDVRNLETPDPTMELHCSFGWSPDGERLLCEGYGIDDPSRNGIYSVRASDGGDLTRITSNPGGEDTPGEYSPDGTRLVFIRFENEAPVGYFVTNVDGTGEPRQLTPDGMGLDDDSHFGGSWSPSGDDILFEARETADHHKAIWIVNADEGAPRQLPIIMPCGGPLDTADEYGCYSPDWSPDGDRIVFTRSEPDRSNETLWIVNADGSNPVQVTDGTDDNPYWGPPTTT